MLLPAPAREPLLYWQDARLPHHAPGEPCSSLFVPLFHAAAGALTQAATHDVNAIPTSACAFQSWQWLYGNACQLLPFSACAEVAAAEALTTFPAAAAPLYPCRAQSLFKWMHEDTSPLQCKRLCSKQTEASQSLLRLKCRPKMCGAVAPALTRVRPADAPDRGPVLHAHATVPPRTRPDRL